MASEAQVLANRRNAEKSTGPRTEEGKAASAQNAVKHGLLARQDVISSEDHEEFDLHRGEMLGELAAVGPVETMLAERIVSLSWRLKRAERIGNEAFDYLFAKDTSGPAVKLPRLMSAGDPTTSDPTLVLGRTVVRDFSNERVMDRLLMYERRIESSLYKSMAELQKLKLLRQLETEEKPVRKLASPAAGQLCKTNPISASRHDAEPGTLGGERGRLGNEAWSLTTPIRSEQTVDMRTFTGDNADSRTTGGSQAMPIELQGISHG
jgi:hypothetical protein